MELGIEDKTIEESKRLAILEEYALMDTLAEKEYDDITKLAAFICDSPIGQITLVGEDRTWYKSSWGMEVKEVSRDISICAHTINSTDEALEVEDLTMDSRFSHFPYVGNEKPKVSYYAGVPLVSPSGYALGAICVVDYKSKKLSRSQLETLEVLSRQVVQLFELRKSNQHQQMLNKELELRNENLKRFASVAAHDIKAPLSKMKMATNMILENHAEELNEEILHMVNIVNKSSDHLQQLVQDILDQSKEAHLLASHKKKFELRDFLVSVAEVSDFLHEVKFCFMEAQGEVLANSVALEQIFLNLFSNAIKYNSKKHPEIRVIFKEQEEVYSFQVVDNGDGVRSGGGGVNIFDPFYTAGSYDSNSQGIGLATVKRLVEGLGGEISYTSKIGLGTTFSFTIKK